MGERVPFDLESYVQRVKNGPCFICEMLKGNPEYKHYLIYEDASTVAFLAKYVTLYGHVLVAPREHFTQVTGDFSPEEYLNLQSVVYRVAEALRQAVPTERIYILSLGSQQGNSHVHWHVAPLPPGVPYEKQQFHALMTENGVLSVPYEDLAGLALQIKRRLA